jgi:hypothetical protein
MWHLNLAPAVGWGPDVVRRVEPLVLVGIGGHTRRDVVLVAHCAAGEMLARELSALTIEVLPLLLFDASIVLRPAHLAIVRNVAPNQVAPLRARARPSAHKRPVTTV